MNRQALIELVRSNTGYHDPDVYTDAIIMSWALMGEERINRDLRIDDMIQIDLATIYTSRIGVPPDWLATDMLFDDRDREMRYQSRSAFYTANRPRGSFTVVGRTLLIGGKPDEVDGRVYELHYFGQVPALVDDPTWLTSKHPRLYLAAVMTAASMHMKDFDLAAVWEAEVSGAITTLNDTRGQNLPRSARLNRKPKGYGNASGHNR